MGLTDSSEFDGVFSTFATQTKGFAQFLSPFHTTEAGSVEDAGATSILLGSMIGGGMQAYANYQDRKAETGAFDEAVEWDGKNMGWNQKLWNKHHVDIGGKLYDVKQGEEDEAVLSSETQSRMMTRVNKDLASANHSNMAGLNNDKVYNNVNNTLSLSGYL